MTWIVDWFKRLLGREGKVEQEVHPVAWSAMASFLEDLEELGEEHEEVYDTQVRETLWEVADGYLLKQSCRLSIPDELGMFSPEANSRLKSTLEENLPRLKEAFGVFGLDTEAKRRVSFLNPKLRTEKGRYVDDFFGSP